MIKLRRRQLLKTFALLALPVSRSASGATGPATSPALQDSGATARYTSVSEFGARGDGLTDDSAAIQAAIDAMHAQGGGRACLPETSAGYRLRRPLNLKSGVVLCGDQNRPRLFPATVMGSLIEIA